MLPLKVRLAGVSHGDCQENIKNYANPTMMGIDEYDLIREPENPFDPNAIRVGLGTINFGYVPKEHARVISPIMDGGQNLVAEFVSVNSSPVHNTVGLTVRITEKN
ncbi:MAG: hypothetical protein HUN04_04505 [Desulfobacter sp.]|nr:MAG: hypothetical protein HUN04_04505 [Desulfobacter sp.]